jgi:hypothetical protein
MIHITDIYTLKARVEKLKHKLDSEQISPHEKWVTHKYLSEVLNYIDELKIG